MRKELADKIPKIKKSIREFVSDESGSVSKDGILKVGLAVGLGTILLSTTAASHSSHTRHSVSGSYSPYTVTGSHGHHGQHSSHSNHSSY